MATRFDPAPSRWSAPAVPSGGGRGGFRVALSVAAVALASWSAPPTRATNDESRLFATTEPLRIELIAGLGSLCRTAARRGCVSEIPATLLFEDDGAPEGRIEVRLRTRGEWRAARAHCTVPPLFVDFGDATAIGTPFDGHRTLPLTTHCRTRPRSYERYVVLEYLAYRIYTLLADTSLRARLAQFTYREPERPKKAIERYGFFVEHFESLAARADSEHVPTADLDLSPATARQVATLELFQFMIGNTDWSVVEGHNVTYLRDADGLVTPVPFDFDFSGLVDAAYALPPPQLPIRRVTDRHYRGFCHADLDWNELFQTFRDQREEIVGLVEWVPVLSERERARTTAFLEEFFAILDSPERRRSEIVDACRPLQR